MRVAFWDALPGPARTALERAGTVALIRPGAFLAREHTRSTHVHVLRSGAAKVWVDRGGETVILEVLGPGDVAGEMEIADGGERYANVEALTRVEALTLPGDRFRTVMSAHPDAMWALAAVLSEKLRDADELRTAHFPDEPGRRLASRLRRLVERFGTPVATGGVVVPVPLCQRDLGRWAGMGRRKVAQLLARERVGDGIAVSRTAITLRSPAVLDRLAGEEADDLLADTG
ncbi:Crp/Fnr family transcriptional regulator [Actinomadura logoneensis]|uniref:Crp/Fnr family transcriptional regulator n=1 Tax=Actinomadura logoneensis TaxID=2293572 RepID=A0A372JQZ7_9ACTN|nr:Crp/Fnr family transcriptional regulator [Actinomadura logoneensis]RFU42465.1 Crp/Fnr family transcriptional regulator [Actinomadura logoneensis]